MTIKLSDSVTITQIGTESFGTIFVDIDAKYTFEYSYSPESPCRSFEQLALESMAKC